MGGFFLLFSLGSVSQSKNNVFIFKVAIVYIRHHRVVCLTVFTTSVYLTEPVNSKKQVCHVAWLNPFAVLPLSLLVFCFVLPCQPESLVLWQYNRTHI